MAFNIIHGQVVGKSERHDRINSQIVAWNHEIEEFVCFFDFSFVTNKIIFAKF